MKGIIVDSFVALLVSSFHSKSVQKPLSSNHQTGIKSIFEGKNIEILGLFWLLIGNIS